MAMLGNARISIQVDVGFGDAITPEPQIVDFPTLLDMPAPTLNIYPKYTMIAEKFEVMVSLGIRNSRIKDFYDVWVMSRFFEFDADILQKALFATFERRKSSYPTQIPFAFTDEFYTDSDKQKQWTAFVRKSRINTFSEDTNLEMIVREISDFLMPIIERENKLKTPSLTWYPDKKDWLAQDNKSALL